MNVSDRRDPTCICEGDQRPVHEDVLRLFATLREACAALRLLVPEDLWSDFVKWDERGDHDASHRSICLLALERGCLPGLTGPIHRFLLAGDRPRPDLRKQYLRDLREDWMFPDDPVERHRRSRMFTGRIVELQCADWLESSGWTITGLEALRAGPDIEAERNGERYAFEVKAIGRSDEQFASMLDSLRGGSGLRHPCLESAVNYLLFRIYEGARQLRGCERRRVVLAAIDELAWHDVKIPLKENWIDWAAPNFIEAGPEWVNFVTEQTERYPPILEELGSMIASLDQIWIAVRPSNFEYRREVLIEPRKGVALS